MLSVSTLICLQIKTIQSLKMHTNFQSDKGSSECYKTFNRKSLCEATSKFKRFWFILCFLGNSELAIFNWKNFSFMSEISVLSDWINVQSNTVKFFIILLKKKILRISFTYDMESKEIFNFNLINIHLSSKSIFLVYVIKIYLKNY